MRGWLRSYALMLKWQALSNKPMIPLYAAIEIMTAVGFVIGLGFFIRKLTQLWPNSLLQVRLL